MSVTDKLTFANVALVLLVSDVVHVGETLEDGLICDAVVDEESDWLGDADCVTDFVRDGA